MAINPITDGQVVQLLPALAEAARADTSSADRFVPPRVGILEETASRRHQFVFGRRGVGKSTLLRKIESEATGGTAGDVIFVDIETLRGRPSPSTSDPTRRIGQQEIRTPTVQPEETP